MTSVLSPTLSVPSTSTWRLPTPRGSKSGCNSTAPSPRLAESWAKAAGLASPYPRDRPSRKVSQGNLRRRGRRRGIRVPTAPRGSLSSLGLFSTDRRNKCDSWCRNLKGTTRLLPTGNQPQSAVVSRVRHGDRRRPHRLCGGPPPRRPPGRGPHPCAGSAWRLVCRKATAGCPDSPGRQLHRCS